MNGGILIGALNALREQALEQFSTKQMEDVRHTISNFAIYSAVSGVAANAIPEVGGAAAAIAQTTMVWVLYVRINKALGLDMSENTMKFIGSAVVTNLAINAGTIILAYAAAIVVSTIPGFGQAGSAVVEGVLGYITIYVAAIIYLKMLTQVMKAKGTINLQGSNEEKEIVKGVIKDLDLKKAIKEAKESYKEVIHEVKGRNPNELGLYDMSGNIWEWCNDWYGEYPTKPQDNPKGPEKGTKKVCRGGSYMSEVRDTRVSKRESDFPGESSQDIGFRLALEL